MSSVNLKPDDLPAELKRVLAEIEEDEQKETCDLPGCDNLHRRRATIRIKAPIAISLHFCSNDHKTEAATRWGLKI